MRGGPVFRCACSRKIEVLWKAHLVRFFSAILILTLLCQASARSQTSSLGTLKGVVNDSVGSTIYGALIKVVQWRPDVTRRFEPLTVTDEKSVYADSDRRFSIAQKPGHYDVFIAAPGFSPFAKKVNVETGKETVLSPKLKFDRLTKFVY